MRSGRRSRFGRPTSGCGARGVQWTGRPAAARCSWTAPVPAAHRSVAALWRGPFGAWRHRAPGRYPRRDRVDDLGEQCWVLPVNRSSAARRGSRASGDRPSPRQVPASHCPGLRDVRGRLALLPAPPGRLHPGVRFVLGVAREDRPRVSEGPTRSLDACGGRGGPTLAGSRVEGDCHD